MPELPEVETVCKYLRKYVINKTIKDVNVYELKILQNITLKEFKKNIQNQKILQITRRGKYIIFLLSFSTLISHLRMEGKYFYYSEQKFLKFHKHKMISFCFNDNDILIYSDTRKFGTIHYFLNHNFKNNNPIKKLGIEPFNTNFNELYLKKNWLKTKKAIKKSLLEQNIICGIGNIYADEILFLSKIHPLSVTNKLSLTDLKKIVLATKTILKKAIELEGTTIKSFSSFQGKFSGHFQFNLKVYHRYNQKCFNCNFLIKKIKLSNRSSFFCDHCQIQKK